jgi:hypothetical protein
LFGLIIDCAHALLYPLSDPQRAVAAVVALGDAGSGMISVWASNKSKPILIAKDIFEGTADGSTVWNNIS